jgi:D-glycerate 3-kinase
MDPTGDWRHFVNKQLEEGYADLFAELDLLFFLQAPNFEAVFRWRLEQEEKLAAKSAVNSAGIMDCEQIADFMQHYERLTQANFLSLPKIANIVLELDDNHDCVQSRRNDPK